MIVVGFAPAIMTSLEGAGGLGWLPVAGFGAGCLLLAAGAALLAGETVHAQRLDGRQLTGIVGGTDACSLNGW